MLTFICSHLKSMKPTSTSHSDCPNLQTFHGQSILTSPWREATKINRQALVGSKTQKLWVHELLVVNGSLKARQTHFQNLEANGHIDLSQCSVEGLAELFRKTRADSCIFNQLELYGTYFYFQDTVIHGTIRVRSPFGRRPKIFLKRSVAKQGFIFEHAKGSFIRL
jgi:hypothetical protein